MAPLTLLVIADPAEPRLAMLKDLPKGTEVLTGKDAPAFQDAVERASAILNWDTQNRTLRELLPQCPHLKWVHTRMAGIDTLLFDELVDHPCDLTNGTGTFSPALGEFVIAGVLYFARDIPRLLRNQREGRWEPFDVTEIGGQTMGIIGYGDIGRQSAARAKALGMEVLAVRRHAPTNGAADPYASRVYPPERRLEMIAASDYVVVATPLTPETRGMVGEAEIAAMKPSAVMINVGRGPVIDEPALIRALSEGRIKGAALDVFEHEPLRAGHPFYSMANVLVSPHSADHTPDWVDNSMRLFLEQFHRFAKGEPLLNVVDKQLGY